jgi:predicted Zn-dependent peptidase
MRLSTSVRLAGAAALLAATSSAAVAQQPLQITQAPALGAAPQLVLPSRVEGTLANGLKWTLVEMHEVPLVNAQLLVDGGARREGPLAGLASFTAEMLDEGAGTRDALGIAAQAEFLGAELRTFASRDRIGLELNVPKRTVDSAFALLADLALRPHFRASEVARQRDLRLAGILQRRDQPEGASQVLFASVVYPKDHPYRTLLGGDSASTAQLDSARVRALWAQQFTPSRARLILTGDLTPAEAQALAERHFGAWRAPASLHGRLREPFTPRPAKTVVYLMDKPGAAQSVIAIGQPGAHRCEPDWAATEVMNTILGGSFTARLNANLRETKGYTYGASSRFDYQPLPGAWLAGAAVRTNVTDSALVEFVKEFRRLRDEPVPADELARFKQFLILGQLGSFETTGQMAERIATADLLGLPWRWYADYAKAIDGVTQAQVMAAARKYIDPARLVITVVGDAAKIRAGLEALDLGEVKLVTMDGAPVAAASR